MTTHNNMQIVREKCIEAVPSIKDLVFGCKVNVEYEYDSFSHEYPQHKTISGTLTNTEIDEVTGDGRIELIDNSGDYNCIDVSIGDIEIIGRAITLADVLIALPDSIFINTKGEIWSNKATEETDATWNLLKPLEEQSEEVITMLANLLK